MHRKQLAFKSRNGLRIFENSNILRKNRYLGCYTYKQKADFRWCFISSRSWRTTGSRMQYISRSISFVIWRRISGGGRQRQLRRRTSTSLTSSRSRTTNPESGPDLPTIQTRWSRWRRRELQTGNWTQIVNKGCANPSYQSSKHL